MRSKHPNNETFFVPSRLVVGALLVAGGLALVIMGGRLGGRAAHPPRRAARFLNNHAALKELPAFAPAFWRPYLARTVGGGFARIAPGGDAAAKEGSAQWRAYLARADIRLVMTLHHRRTIKAARKNPDGSKTAFERPAYLALMPRARWALVYYDDRALLFVRRDALAAVGLAAAEYRNAGPGDEAVAGKLP